MKPWALFSHSVSMLVRNFGDLLRVFLMPALLILVVCGVFLKATGLLDVLQWGAMTPLPKGSGLAGPMFLVVILSLLIGMWSVVAWHRFVLLEDLPEGWMPALRADRVLAYLGRSVQIALVLICLMLPLALVALLLVSVLNGMGPSVLALINLPLTIVVTYIVLRLSVLLPAAALGAPMGLREAWSCTSGAFGDLMGLSAIMVALQFAAQFIIDASAGTPSLAAAVSLVISVVLALVNISLLTTLFGHYVEGRPV